MTVVDNYLQNLNGTEAALIRHMYEIGRQQIPAVSEALSYNMPTLMYKNKGVMAVLANKNFISLYPFCNHDQLGVDVSGYETTKGSIHFTVDQPLPDELLRAIIAARLTQIAKHGTENE